MQFVLTTNIVLAVVSGALSMGIVGHDFLSLSMLTAVAPFVIGALITCFDKSSSLPAWLLFFQSLFLVTILILVSTSIGPDGLASVIAVISKPFLDLGAFSLSLVASILMSQFVRTND